MTELVLSALFRDSWKPHRSITMQTWRLLISSGLQKRAERRSTPGWSSRQKVSILSGHKIIPILVAQPFDSILCEWLLCLSFQIRLKIFWSQEQSVLWQDWLWLMPSTSRETGWSALILQTPKRCPLKPTRWLNWAEVCRCRDAMFDIQFISRCAAEKLATVFLTWSSNLDFSVFSCMSGWE